MGVDAKQPDVTCKMLFIGVAGERSYHADPSRMGAADGGELNFCLKIVKQDVSLPVTADDHCRNCCQTTAGHEERAQKQGHTKLSTFHSTLVNLVPLECA
jgi:hypothetical protein